MLRYASNYAWYLYMKKFLALISLAVSTFMFTACAPTQEMREGVSFEGLTHYYIMPISGGDNFFRQFGNRQRFDDALIEGIKEIMAERGFTHVATPEEAQFALRPIYSEWTFNDTFRDQSSSRMWDNTPIALRQNQLFVNLEIEAYLPNMERWAWRNFSYTRISRNNISFALIREQARWCLMHFPPESFPSQTQMNTGSAAKEDAPSEDVKKN
jgi:hypothetical protein